MSRAWAIANIVTTLSEISLTVPFSTVKYIYKYYFSSLLITCWLSTTTLWRSKTYCLALQKRRFCKVKAAVLQRKTYAFGKQKKKYCFSVKIFRNYSKVKWGTWIAAVESVGKAMQGSVVTMFAMAHALLIYLWLSGGFPPPAAGHPCVVFSGIDY